jgi:hypothetical protein
MPVRFIGGCKRFGTTSFRRVLTAGRELLNNCNAAIQTQRFRDLRTMRTMAGRDGARKLDGYVDGSKARNFGWFKLLNSPRGGRFRLNRWALA